MIASSRMAAGEIEVFVQKRSLNVLDIDRLQSDVSALFTRADVRRVVMNLRAVERVDSSLVNLLRYLAGEAHAAGRAFHVTELPRELELALSAPSFLMRWTSGVVRPDARSPMGTALSHRSAAS